MAHAGRGVMSRRTMLGGISAVLAGGVWVASGQHVQQASADSGAGLTATIRPEHPRILATADDFAALRSRIQEDSLSASWYETIVAEADAMLSQPVVTRGTGMLPSPRVYARSQYLGLVFQITGDTRYAERLWQELEAAAAFEDWQPDRFLSTGEMIQAFAIGYDWIFDYLTQEQRATVRDAIEQHGLLAAKAAYDSGEWWVHAEHNWSIVGHAGAGMGALAVADELPELAEEIITRGRQWLTVSVAEYGPDGAYPEGLGYWAYATRFLVPYLAALHTALGDDLGISEIPGLDQAGYYPLYTTGTSGLGYNYYDAGEPKQGTAELLWLANFYDKPVYSWHGSRTDFPPNPRRLLWYTPGSGRTPADAGLPYDRYFRRVEVVTFRGAWQDPNAPFAGFKGGDNQTNHADLDLGSFVFDALGIRWASDLGRGNGSAPGYYANGPEGRRWLYYRKRAEGHNTLVVNPSQGPDQDPLAVGTVIAHESGPLESFAVADLTSACSAHPVSSWLRGTALIEHRRQMLVQDELRADQPVDAWWFMHTRADVQVADDGRSALLSSEGRQVRVEMASAPDGAAFVVMDAEPLPDSPDPDEAYSNAGVRKLAIELADVTELRLAVALTPLRGDGPGVPERPEVQPLADWAVAHHDVPHVSGIIVDGAALSEFEPGNYTYDVELPVGATTPPRVSAIVPDARARVRVNQARRVPGTAEVIVTRPGAPAVRYLVHAAPMRPGPRVTASQDGTFPPEFSIDGDRETWFSLRGSGQWIQYNMNERATIDGVALAWGRGDERIYSFDILTSLDGRNWQQAVRSSSSGSTLLLEDHTFDPIMARYVRVVCYGNTENDWMTLTEARILRHDGVWPAELA